jgi:hypothetical protein
MVSEADGLHRAVPVVDVRSKLCHDDNTNVAKLFFRGRYIGSASDHPGRPLFALSSRLGRNSYDMLCGEEPPPPDQVAGGTTQQHTGGFSLAPRAMKFPLLLSYLAVAALSAVVGERECDANHATDGSSCSSADAAAVVESVLAPPREEMVNVGDSPEALRIRRLIEAVSRYGEAQVVEVRAHVRYECMRVRVLCFCS